VTLPLAAVALLGSVLTQSGAELIGGFHMAMLISAAACVVAVVAALSIAPPEEAASTP
jgi:hypothetical protein